MRCEDFYQFVIGPDSELFLCSCPVQRCHQLYLLLSSALWILAHHVLQRRLHKLKAYALSVIPEVLRPSNQISWMGLVHTMVLIKRTLKELAIRTHLHLCYHVAHVMPGVLMEQDARSPACGSCQAGTPPVAHHIVCTGQCRRQRPHYSCCTTACSMTIAVDMNSLSCRFTYSSQRHVNLPDW